jgi:hypothetical protein
MDREIIRVEPLSTYLIAYRPGWVHFRLPGRRAKRLAFSRSHLGGA